MSEVEFGYVLKGLFLPPGGCAMLVLLGLALLARWRAVGVTLLVVGAVSLWVLATPMVAGALVRGLETAPPLDGLRPEAAGAGAIVVLGSNRYAQAPEYGRRDVAGARLLQRLQYAAYLHARTGLPILTTGGRLGGWEVSEAAVMREVLRESFGTPVAWVEERSENTEQNARYSRDILVAAGVTRVLVVTHATHMPRALESFRRAGLEAVPAPTVFHLPSGKHSLVDWLPDAAHLQLSRDALHEHIGRAWYRLRYGAPEQGES